MKKARPFVGELLLKIADRVGVIVEVEPEFGYVGRIICPNGKIHYFRDTKFDLNTLGATEIAQDKAYAEYFIEKLGFPTIPGKPFYSKKWATAIESDQDIDAAYAYAKEIGFPVFVKPNSRSQGSRACKANTRREFYRAFRQAAQKDKVVLVQQVVIGHDYRIVVLDDQIISAYERLPLKISGDGSHTIAELLAIKQQDFYAEGRDTELPLDDYRIKMRLLRMKMSLETILRKDESCQLLDNANLSSGGDALDVTKIIHPEFKKIAIELTKGMGLRYCGVDLMIDGDVSKAPNQYWVIEINAAPGIDNYSSSGPEQQQIVEDLYTKVLEGIARL